MNKLLIPTILAASVLIAGIFAFMPIEKATTVHNTIIGSDFAPRLVTGSCNTDGDTNDGSMDSDDGGPCDVTIDIEEGVVFQVIGVEASITNRNGDESFDPNRLCYGPEFANFGWGMGRLNEGGGDQRVSNEGHDRKNAAVGLGEGTLIMDNEVDEDPVDDVEDEIVTINIIMLMRNDAPDPVLTFVGDLPSNHGCGFGGEE